MNDIIKFVQITNDNLEIACKIQNAIFPEEDARANFIEQINKAPYRKEMEYYIVYSGDIPVGVTGLYSYHEYPDDAWLGWFGILQEYRKNGYGSYVFDKTVELAISKGYKNFRLYTDDSFVDAHKLYTKKGMIKEVYDNPDDKNPYEEVELPVYVFSMSLTDKPIEKWNNKILGLKEQAIKEFNHGLI